MTCGMLGAFGFAHSTRPAYPTVDSSRLRSGDLVFRVGIGWRADVVRVLSRDSLSHVGIAVVEADGVHVVHAEPPGEDGPGGVVDQTLAQFSSPASAQGIVAYRRIDISPDVEGRIAEAAILFSRRHIPFDNRFDLADSKAFYCTELVLRASAAASANLRVPRTRIDGGILAGDYVFPRDLITTGRLRALKSGR